MTTTTQTAPAAPAFINASLPWKDYLVEVIKHLGGNDWVRSMRLCSWIQGQSPRADMLTWADMERIMEEDDRCEEACGYWRITPEALNATPSIEVPFRWGTTAAW